MHEPWQWALAALGAFLVGMSKTGIAGLGILTVVIFASILPAKESVGIVLIVLLAGDFIAVTAYRRDASWKHLWKLVPWAAGGIVLGAAVMGMLNDRTVRLVIGVLVVSLSAFQFYRSRNKSTAPPEQLPHWVVAGTGLMAGMTTMIANAAGPFMIIYLLAMRLPKLQFVGTAAWFFLGVNLFKVPFSYGLGLITPGSFGVSLRLVPFAIAGALSGRWLIHRIDQHLFESIALWLTLAAGLRLLLT